MYQMTASARRRKHDLSVISVFQWLRNQGLHFYTSLLLVFGILIAPFSNSASTSSDRFAIQQPNVSNTAPPNRLTTNDTWEIGDVVLSRSYESLQNVREGSSDGAPHGTHAIYDNNGNYKDSVDGPDTTGRDCAFDVIGNLYASVATVPRVSVFSGNAPHNLVQQIDTSINGQQPTPGAIVFLSNGDFLVAVSQYQLIGIERFNSAGVRQDFYDFSSTGIYGVIGMDLSTDQRTLFYTVNAAAGSGRVYRYDLVTRQLLSDFANVGYSLRGIKLLPPSDGTGGLLVSQIDYPSTSGNVRRLDGSGAIVQTYDVAGQDEWDGIDLDPNGTSFWSDSHTRAYRFNVATGVVESGPFGPYTSIPTSKLCVNKVGTRNTNTPKPNEVRCGGSPSQDATTRTAGYGVNTATGDFCYQSEDFSIPARGVPLMFARSYSASLASITGTVTSTITSTLGAGWTHNYNMYIGRDGDSNYLVHEENGSVSTFAQDFSAPIRVMATLTATGSLSNTELLFTRIHGQTKFYFRDLNSSGVYRLDRIVDRNNHSTKLLYDLNGRLQTVTSQYGEGAGQRSLMFEYWPDNSHSPGMLQRLTDNAGRVVSFEYQEGNLRTARDMGGTLRTFYYDSNNRLSYMTEPRNNNAVAVFTNTYEIDTGRVLRQDFPLGRYVQLGYSGVMTTGASTRITNTLGLVTVHDYTQYMLNRVTELPGTQQEAIWSYEYQPGTTWFSSKVDPLQHAWSSTWDYAGNLLSTQDPVGRVYTYTYSLTNDLYTVIDPASVTTTYAYDPYGNLTKVSRPLTQTSEYATTFYGYDYSFGRQGDLLKTQDPRNNVWSNTYDVYGYPQTASDPLGNTAHFSYDSVGRLYGQIDANGNPSSYARNAYGDPVSITNALSYTSVYTYDAVRNLQARMDPKLNVTLYDYDDNNEVRRVNLPDSSYIEYSYDGVGRVFTQTDELRHEVARYTYDDLSRQYNVRDAIGRAMQYSFDKAGNMWRAQDAQGRYTYYYHYPDNLLQTVDYTDGVTPDVQYTYNSRGLRESMSDGTGTSVYGYDSLDRLSSVQDGGGHIVGYHYDLANNVQQVDYPRVLYDNNYLPRFMYYQYDQANHNKQVSYSAGGYINLDYDPNGNLTTITYPWTTFTQKKIGYDATNQIISTATYVANETPPLYIQYSRDPAGLINSSIEKITNAYGGTTLRQSNLHQYQYDQRNRLVSDLSTDAVTSNVVSNTFQYDAASQLTQTLSIPNSGDVVTTTRQYDYAGQMFTLHEYTPTRTLRDVTVAYDAHGNRRSLRDAVGGIGGGGQVFTYTFNMADQMVSYYNNAYQTDYKYNGDGLRTQKIDPNYYFGGTRPITYTWDIKGVGAGGLPMMLQEIHPAPMTLPNEYYTSSYMYSPGGEAVTREVVSTGRRPDAPNVPNVPDALIESGFYYLSDGQGSIRLLRNDVSQLKASYSYDAYGRRSCTMPGGASCEASTPFGYTGQYQDEESSLLYLRARYYDPSTQQFISRDPLEGKTGQPYGYAYGNPVNYVDPSGLEGIGVGGEEELPLGAKPASPGVGARAGANLGEPLGAEGASGAMVARGTIQYGELDEHGRSTGVEAIITRNMPKGSAAEASPQGWVKGITGNFYDRAHLLAKRFGGSGYTKKNLAIVLRPVNQITMRGYEEDIAGAVASGEAVWYRATPIYRGDTNEPYAITLEALGNRGFFLGVSIFNR